MGNMDKTTETGGSKTQSAVVTALVIGLLVGFFIGRSWGEKYEEGVDDGAQVGEMASTTSKADSILDAKNGSIMKDFEKKETMTADGNLTGAVDVVDQSAGMVVAVEKVSLSNAGWVVVREDAGNGMGNILGAQWLPAGDAENVSVDLLRATEANKNYFVALYNDNGDKKFDKTADLPIAVDGRMVSAVFSVK